MTPLRDDRSLDALLRAAAGRKMTPAEVREQRVSFVYGQMGGRVTKDWVRDRLRESMG